MSEILVGQAYWLASLRYEQLSQGVSAVEQQIKRLQALSKTPISFQAQLPAAGGTGGGGGGGGGSGAGSPASQAAEYTRLQRAQATLEAQQARLARSQGDTARAAALEAQAQQRLSSELQAQSGVTTQSIALERQLTTVQQQAARGAQQAAEQQRAAMDAQRASLQRPPTTASAPSGGGGIGVLGQAAGLVGIGLGAAQLVSFSKDALNAANSLERTEATVRALSGSQARYNEVLEVAKTGQQAYGGSLEENLRGLGTLVNLSNRAGVSLGTLDNISRRLAIVDPVQGIEGANIALKEFLSGNNAEAALSLARRFELPRAALAALAQEGTTAQQRLDGLNKLLNEQGITTQVLTDRTKTQAATYDRLGAAALNARDAVGALIAAQGAPAASQATGALTGVTQLITAYNELATKNQDAFNALQGWLNPIQTYNNAVLGAGANVLKWAGALTSATPAIQTQTDIEGLRTQRIITTTQALGLQIDMEDRRVQQLNANAAASGLAIRAQIDAINQSAQASVADSAAKDAQQNTTALLAAQAKLSVDSFLQLNPRIDESGVAALVAAGKLNPFIGQLAALQLQASSAADELIKLNNAQNQKATNAVVATNRFFGRESGRGGGSDAAAESGAFVSALQKQRQEQQKLLDSEIALAGAKKQTAREIDLLRQKQGQYAKGTAEFNQIEAQIIGIQLSGGKTRVSAAQTTALQLNQVEQNSGLALLKTQRENLERLRDQAEDFDVRRGRAQEDFAEKRRILLEKGEKGQVARLSAEFEKDQRREREDFDRQRRRTLRNNAEGVGDIDARTDLRQSQISDRAALRGVRTAGGVDLGQAPPRLTGGAGAGGDTGRVLTLRVQIAPSSVQIDGHQIVEITWPEFEQKVDTELADALIMVPVGSGQPAVAGLRP